MRITRVENHPHLIPRLAAAFAAEWPEWAAGRAPGELEAIFAPGAGGALPIVLVACEGERLLGTVALRAWMAEEPMDETPWVRQLWVAPGARGRGLGTRLLEAVAAEARALGHDALYVATDRIAPWLARRGWRPLGPRAHRGATIDTLRRAL